METCIKSNFPLLMWPQILPKSSVKLDGKLAINDLVKKRCLWAGKVQNQYNEVMWQFSTLMYLFTHIDVYKVFVPGGHQLQVNISLETQDQWKKVYEACRTSRLKLQSLCIFALLPNIRKMRSYMVSLLLTNNSLSISTIPPCSANSLWWQDSEKSLQPTVVH